jgi:hypothetical protein
MIDAPQVSLAKIGQRFYWTVYRRNMGIARIADGFADSRELAAEQAAAALEEAAPGFSELLLQLRLNADVWRGNFHVADEDIKTLARNPGKASLGVARSLRMTELPASFTSCTMASSSASTPNTTRATM